MLHLALQPDPTQPYSSPAYSTPGYAVNPPMWHHVLQALQESIGRVLALLVLILPALLSFLLALALLTLLGVFLSWALRKILTAARFDERMNRNENASLTEWTSTRSPTALVGRIAFWACVLGGVFIGLSAFDTAFQSGSAVFTVSLLPYLTHSVGAILLLIAGNVLARFLARTVLIGAVNSNLQYARFLSLGVKWLVLVLTAAMVLDHLQIGGNIVELAFGILFGGIVLTLSLAIGLGSRELVSRSLERGTEAKPDRASENPLDTLRTGTDAIPYTPRPTTPSETLRHF